MSVEHERALLGAIILEPALLDRSSIAEGLFTDRRHRAISRALQAMRDSGKPVDLLTLADEFGDHLAEAGGAVYLAGLTSSVPTSANALYYLEALREEHRRRVLRRLGSHLADAEKNGASSKDLVALVEEQLVRLRATDFENSTILPSDAIMQVIQRVEERMKAGMSGPTGVPSGFPTLDGMTGGLQPGDLILLAARTSVGKTALALSMIDDQLRRGIPIALASLEMSAVQVWERLLAMRSLVPTGRLRFGHLGDSDFTALMGAAGELQSTSLRIIDKPDLCIRALRSWVLGQAEEGARILYVDYAGLLAGGNEDAPRWDRMAEISHGLKTIARELRIPLICLVQLNREAADSREPGLHHLRDSGAFEQDADIVLLLTRSDKESADDSVPARLIIAKHRNGPTGRISLLFRRSLTQFREEGT